MFLPSDVCRCLDNRCGVRYTCGRFHENVDKSENEDRVVLTSTLKDDGSDEDLPCDFYIESGMIIEIDNETRAELFND